MDIVARNLFRLLRNGAFGTQELMEPMSAYKWERLYQLALVHRVVNYAYQGLQNSRDQFFVNLPEKQKEAWLKAVGDTSKQMPAMEDEEDELLRADQFTNPVINHQLQNILDDEHSDTNTRQMLLMIIRVVRHILNEGMPICQLLELGIFMRQQGAQVDYNTLKGWISKLRLAPMSQLEGELLILLFGFQPEQRNCWTLPTPARTTGISRKTMTVSSCTTATVRPCSVMYAALPAISDTIPQRVSPTSLPRLYTPCHISKNRKLLL